MLKRGEKMNRLKELREAKSLTQSQVAEKIGISQQAYSLIETGQNTPSLETALLISNFFKKPVNKIFLFNKTS